MPYRDEHSIDAARHNSLDHRLSGILDFDTRNTLSEGQAAISIGSGGTGIELDLEGANVLLNGSKVSVPPNTVPISDGHASLWRVDHIVATEDGVYDVLPGEPGDNRYVEHSISGGEIEHSIVENETAGGPAPKGTSLENATGELLYSVLVPPGATSGDALAPPEQYIWDRRRLAPDVLDLGRPRQPSIGSDLFELPAGEWNIWPVTVWEGQTLRLWEYSVGQERYGLFESDNFTLYLVEYGDLTDDIETWQGDGPDWESAAVWQSSTMLQNTWGDDQDTLVDIDVGDGSKGMAFVLVNEGDFDYTGVPYRLTFQATCTIENTDDL